MVMFGAKFRDTINKYKALDCKCNLSSITLKDNQMVYLRN